MRQTELHFGDEDRELIESCRAWFAPRTGNQSGTRLVSLGSEAHLKPRSCRFPASDEPSWRIRVAYLEDGAEHALHDFPRPGKPRRSISAPHVSCGTILTDSRVHLLM